MILSLEVASVRVGKGILAYVMNIIFTRKGPH